MLHNAIVRSRRKCYIDGGVTSPHPPVRGESHKITNKGTCVPKKTFHWGLGNVHVWELAESLRQTHAPM